MRLLMLGAPGSGKGTQAERLAAHFGITHLATGNMLRREVQTGTEIGRQVESVLAAGDLVSDEVIENLLYPAFVAASEAGGFVLDGFPRTLHQAERAFSMALEIGATLQAVIHLDVPRDILVERALGRSQGRADDTQATVAHRIDVYERETLPLTDYYAGRGILVTIDGIGAPDDIFDAIVKQLTA